MEDSSLDEGRITFGRRRELSLIARDPVCDMDVEVARAAASTDHENRTYYFCSMACKHAFDQQPELYALG
jgi:YHS domain-containing protein